MNNQGNITGIPRILFTIFMLFLIFMTMGFLGIIFGIIPIGLLVYMWYKMSFG